MNEDMLWLCVGRSVFDFNIKVLANLGPEESHFPKAWIPSVKAEHGVLRHYAYGHCNSNERAGRDMARLFINVAARYPSC
jgi:hypothetical protein